MPIEYETKIIESPLHHNQIIIWRHPARFKILVAGRRWGKTTLAIKEVLNHTLDIEDKYGNLVKDNSNKKAWYIGPTYRQAKMIAWKMLLDNLNYHSSLEKNEVDLSVKFLNGSEVSLKGADNPDSLRGVGLNYCVLDEYSQMKPEIWEEIIRPMLIDSGGKAMFISTPKGKDHLYKMFLREKTDSDYKSFHFTSYDNPLINKSEIDKAKSETSETYFKQEYLASFEDYEGLVWPEWDEKYHVIPDLPKIPKDWHKWRFWDMATSGVVACLWMAVDMSGNLIYYREYYERGKMPSLNAQTVKTLTKDEFIDLDLSCHWAFAETQADKKTGKWHTLADEYKKDGIYLYPAVNAKDAGAARVSEMLTIRKDIPHPFYPDLMGSPRIFVCQNCKHTIEQIPLYKRVKKETLTEVNYVYDERDVHCCDLVRFGAMSRPSASEEHKEIHYNEWGEPPIEVMIDEAAYQAEEAKHNKGGFYD